MVEAGRSTQLQHPIVHEPATPERTRESVRLFRCWHETVLIGFLAHDATSLLAFPGTSRLLPAVHYSMNGGSWLHSLVSVARYRVVSTPLFVVVLWFLAYVYYTMLVQVCQAFSSKGRLRRDAFIPFQGMGWVFSLVSIKSIAWKIQEAHTSPLADV